MNDEDYRALFYRNNLGQTPPPFEDPRLDDHSGIPGLGGGAPPSYDEAVKTNELAAAEASQFQENGFTQHMETSLGEPDPYSSAGAQNWQQNPQLKSHEEHCNHSPANVRQQQTYTHVPHGASNRNYPGSQTLTYTNSNNQPRR